MKYPKEILLCRYCVDDFGQLLSIIKSKEDCRHYNDNICNLDSNKCVCISYIKNGIKK